MPRDRIAGSYGSSVSKFFRNLHTVFHCSYTNLYSHQQCMKVLFYPYPCQHLLFLVYLIVDILTGVRWYLIMVLHFPDYFWDLFCGLACDLSWRKFHVQNWNIFKSVLILDIEVVPMFSPLSPTLWWLILHLNCFSSPGKGIWYSFA